jgi:hypothetical protein
MQRDEEWMAVWELARRAMEPWDRRPAPYLIDRLLDPDARSRRWLVFHLEHLARSTREREHDLEQQNGVLRWDVPAIGPGGVRHVIRVLVSPTGEIFNAFPDRGRR